MRRADRLFQIIQRLRRGRLWTARGLAGMLARMLARMLAGWKVPGLSRAGENPAARIDRETRKGGGRGRA